jgi:hypothetical protein
MEHPARRLGTFAPSCTESESDENDHNRSSSVTNHQALLYLVKPQAVLRANVREPDGSHSRFARS